MNLLPSVTSIDCQALHVALGSKSEQPLLTDISCQFSGGSITAILGKNGAGKSTLLKVLSKQNTAYEGRIEFDGSDLAEFNLADLAQQRAVLTQQNPVAFSMSVKDLVSLGADVQANLTQLRIDEVLSFCDLTAFASRDVLTLSGGELQRAHIARVLAQIWPESGLYEGSGDLKHKALNGKWLFLDEWTNNLDLHHHQAFASLFKQLSHQGLGIIMVMHDLNLAVSLADDIKVLNTGRMVLDGTPREVLTPQSIKQHLGLEVEMHVLAKEEDRRSCYQLYLR